MPAPVAHVIKIYGLLLRNFGAIGTIMASQSVPDAVTKGTAPFVVFTCLLWPFLFQAFCFTFLTGARF